MPSQKTLWRMSNRKAISYDQHVMNESHEARPYAAWTAKDRIGDEILSTLTVILKTSGCTWSRCRMCSYRNVRLDTLHERDLTEQLLAQMSWVRDHFRIEEIECVKIYTSGSFFDPAEVPLPARNAFGTLVKGRSLLQRRDRNSSSLRVLHLSRRSSTMAAMTFLSISQLASRRATIV